MAFRDAARSACLPSKAGMLSRDIPRRQETLVHALQCTREQTPSRPIASECMVYGTDRYRCRVEALLGLRAKVGVGVEAVQAVRDVVLQPQRRHRALAEVCRIQHLRSAEGTVGLNTTTINSQRP